MNTQHGSPSCLQNPFEQETAALARSWMRHDRHALGGYLVRGVQDPRINLPSILTRHFLIGRLFPGRFGELMEQELRFGLVMSWLVEHLTAPGAPEELPSALLAGPAAARAAGAPPYVCDVLGRLPAAADGLVVDDYVSDLFLLLPPDAAQVTGDDPALATFQYLWRQAMADLPAAAGPAGGLSVLEPACGSANDYRYLDSFGLADFLDYAGFDLCDKNVRNARDLFPHARFEVGNVLAIRHGDKSFDCCFVHDLLEHLSIGAMEKAVGEICRVTRQAALVGFFQMSERDDHVVRRVEDYHVNTLSRVRTGELFERHGAAVQAVRIETFLRSRFGCPRTHNPDAYVSLVTMGP